MSAVAGVLGIRATWMRGDALKALCIAADDLPGGILQRPSVRDALLCRLLGSPHRDRRMIDGLGPDGGGYGRIVIASRSLRPACDVEFLHGVASSTHPAIDWSTPCDQLAAAVASFAVARGWVAATRAPDVAVRLRQQVAEQTITAWVPTRDGVPLETGTFDDDGVPCGAAETRLEFVGPAAHAVDGLFPTGLPCDRWHLPELADVPPAPSALAEAPRGTVRVTWIDVGTPLLCVRADAVKLTGRETPDAIQRDTKAMARLAALGIRCGAAHAGSIAPGTSDARASPVIALVAAPAAYRTFDGRDVDAQAVDLLVRLVERGRVLDGCPGHAAMALAAAAALPGTVVSEVARTLPGVPTRIGHPYGIVTAGALLVRRDDQWHVERTTMSRSARRLMDGTVYVPVPAPTDT